MERLDALIAVLERVRAHAETDGPLRDALGVLLGGPVAAPVASVAALAPVGFPAPEHPRPEPLGETGGVVEVDGGAVEPVSVGMENGFGEAKASAEAPPPQPAVLEPDEPPAEVYEPIPLDEARRRLAAGIGAEAPPLPLPVRPLPVAEIEPPPLDDLADAERAFALKAKAARLAVERASAYDEGAEAAQKVGAKVRRLQKEAGEGAFEALWPLDRAPTRLTAEEAARFEELGGAFEAAAKATALVHKRLDDTPREEQGLIVGLFAEALSALRVAALKHRERDDPDQYDAFIWLRRYTNLAGVFVPRHMKVSDPADPAGWADLVERVRHAAGPPRKAGDLDPEQKAHLNKLKYHLGQIAKTPLADHARDLEKASEAVTDLVRGGMPESAVVLREALLPHLDRFPEDATRTPEVERALREARRYLDLRAEAEADEDELDEAPTEDVRRVAELLRGRTLLVIGGVAKPHVVNRLESAFGPVEWVTTRDHEGTSRFEPLVARPDVALVLVAVRWANHSFDDDVKAYADAYRKPYVRLKAGNHPNRIAREILAQASEQLGAGG